MNQSSSLPSHSNTPHPWHTRLLFALIVLVCFSEALLYRHESWLLTFGLWETTLQQVQGVYPGAYLADNDLDNTPINAEGIALAHSTYQLAGVYDPWLDSPRLSAGTYGADRFRLLLPFLASFLLTILGLNDAYLVINTLFWILTSCALAYLGWRIFSSMRVAYIAGLLCASSYLFNILATDPKLAVFQLGAPACLTALAFYLDHFSNQITPHALFHSLLLGIFSALLMFASFGTAFFLPILLLYGLLSTRWWIFIYRNLLFALGMFAVIATLLLLTQSAPAGGGVGISPQIFTRVDWARWFSVFQDKMLNHFLYAVPWHLWICSIIGFFLLKRNQMKIIACMFTPFLVAEVLMLNASSPYFAWTINYFYLHLIFPIYLLTAHLVERLLWPSTAHRSLRVLTRSTAIAILALTLFTANLVLLGNRYYDYVGARKTPIQILYYSFFTYNNLPVYRDINSNMNRDRK